MSDPEEGEHRGRASEAADRFRIGLCIDCRHARRLVSAKGSSFYRCDRAKFDSRFEPYPPLPVRVCPAYAKRSDDA